MDEFIIARNPGGRGDGGGVCLLKVIIGGGERRSVGWQSLSHHWVITITEGRGWVGGICHGGRSRRWDGSSYHEKTVFVRRCGWDARSLPGID